MKNRILTFVIGALVGSIITTIGFLIYSKTMNKNIGFNGRNPMNMNMWMSGDMRPFNGEMPPFDGNFGEEFEGNFKGNFEGREPSNNRKMSERTNSKV